MADDAKKRCRACGELRPAGLFIGRPKLGPGRRGRVEHTVCGPCRRGSRGVANVEGERAKVQDSHAEAKLLEVDERLRAAREAAQR